MYYLLLINKEFSLVYSTIFIPTCPYKIMEKLDYMNCNIQSFLHLCMRSEINAADYLIDK